MEKPFIIRWKSGKKVDPRLLMLLEKFRELYEEREEFFKKIFPGDHDEFADVFKKVGTALVSRKKKGKVGTIQRSLSLGSSTAGSSREDDESELVNQRFRVRRPAVVVVAASGKGGASSSQGGGTISKGSK